MKFGIRRPSLRKRIAARTSWKRYVRHSLGFKAPRGFGWVTNPKKAAYNRIYNRTTVSADKVAGVAAAAAAAGIGAMFNRKKANATGANSSTTCPRCNSPMVLRNGRLGKFYGCSRFPYCRGTRNYIPQAEPAATTSQRTTTQTQVHTKNRNTGYVWFWAILAFISFASDGAVLGIIFVAIGIYAYTRGKASPQKAYTPPNNPNPNYSQARQRQSVSTPQPQTTVVDPDELKKTYYRLAHKYHPDRARTPEEQKSMEAMMKKINRAYQDKNLQALKAIS